MKKKYIVFVISLIFTISNSFSQGNTCAQATPFCTAIGVPFTYPNIHNNSLAPTGNSYGCLCQYDAYNPSWFYMEATSAGTLNFSISQLSTGGSGIDVDFVAWGPFASTANMCNSLTGSCSSNCTSNSNVTCTGNIEDCGSSNSAVESMSLVATAPGQVFLVMITNFDGVAGNITLTQTSGPPTNCQITCPSVSSGPGIVNAQGGTSTPATPMPAVVSCTTAPLSMYPTTSTPFGHPLQPSIIVGTYANAQNGNTIQWYEGGSYILTSAQTPPNTSYQTIFIGSDPSAVTSFSFCETVNSTDMGSQIFDAATGALITNYTWVSDGVCSGYTLPPGSVKGITTWSSTCGACVTGVTNWGYAVFNPAAASIGTHTISYTFDPQKPGCAPYTTTIAITVTNPFNATFTPPGPLCVNAACATLTPANTYPVGTPGWSGTGVSGNTFCPSISGSGTFPVTYSVGTSPTCRATYNANVVVNALPTVTASIASSGTVCAGTGITLNAGGANTYSWSPGGATSAAVTVTPPASPSVFTYTVQGTNTATGCKNSATVTGTVIPTPTVTVSGPSGANTGTICNGSTISLTAGGGTGYTWSPSTGLSSTTGSLVTASPTVTTIYSVSGSSAGGCNTTASTQGSFTVYVNPTPTIGITPSSSGTVCSGSSSSLTGTGAGAGGTYTWSAPAGGGLSATTGSVVTITPSASPVTYTVIGRTANGCTNTAQSTITVAVTPTISVTNTLSSNSSTICSGNSITLSASGASSYTWAPSATLSSSTGATVTASPTNTSSPTIYTVTGTSSSGCISPASSNGTFTITVSPTPTISLASVTSNTICPGQSTTITPTGGSAGNYTLTPGGSTTSPFVVSPASTTGYTISGTSAGGCMTTASSNSTFTITVSPTPTISMSSITSNTICSGQSVTITPTGGSAGNYTLMPGGSTTSPFVVSPAGTTTYTISGTNSSGCVSTAATNLTTTVTVNATPSLTLSSNNVSLCSGNTLILPTASGGSTFNWSGPNSFTSTVASPTVTTNISSAEAGVYNVTTSAAYGTATCTSAPGQVTVTVVSSAVITASSSNLCEGYVATITPGGGNSYTLTNTGDVSTGSFTLNPTATTVYSLTGSAGAGCDGNTTFTITVLTTPTVGISANTSTICSGNNVILSPVGASTYTLNPGNLSGTSFTLSPSSTTTYSLVGTNTLNCVSTNTANVSITVHASPTLTLAASSGSICAGSSVVLTPAGADTYTLNPGGLTGTSFTLSPSGPTANYSLTGTSSLNCASTNTAVVTVTINALPTFVLGTASTVTTSCASPNASLSANSNADPNAVYTWTTPSSSILTGSMIISSTTGIYSVSVTNTVTGCSNTSITQNTVEVVADAGVPSVGLSSNSLSITCTDPNPTLTATTTASPVNYNWTPTAGILSGTETTATPVFTAAGTYSLVVTNTSSGCASSISSNVVTVTADNLPPNVTLSSGSNSGTITCTNTLVTINPVITPAGGSYTYTWSPATGLSTPANQANATFTAANVYTLTVTNSITGCVTSNTSAANTYTIYQNTNTPTISIIPISTNTVIGCGNSSVTFSSSIVTSSGSSLSYNWSNGATTPTVDIASAGTYSVLVTDNTSGCSAAAQFTVDGNTIPPQNVNAGSNVMIPCGNNSVVLNGTSTSTNVSFSWTGPLGTSIVSGSNTASPLVSDIGTYTLSVTDNLTGCLSTATVVVSQGNITVAFTADPTAGEAPLTVNFTDQSVGAVNYSWNFGDGNTSVSQNPSHVFTGNGTYTVILTASSGPCTDSDTTIIVVNDGLTLTIPNVFTPNADGSNDLFTIASTGVKDISLQIFNRWGEKLYEFAGPKAAWDGLTQSGAEVTEGTYFYFVKAKGFDDKEIEKHGTVNLFR